MNPNDPTASAPMPEQPFDQSMPVNNPDSGQTTPVTPSEPQVVSSTPNIASTPDDFTAPSTTPVTTTDTVNKPPTAPGSDSSSNIAAGATLEPTTPTSNLNQAATTSAVLNQSENQPATPPMNSAAPDQASPIATSSADFGVSPQPMQPASANAVKPKGTGLVIALMVAVVLGALIAGALLIL